MTSQKDKHNISIIFIGWKLRHQTVAILPDQKQININQITTCGQKHIAIFDFPLHAVLKYAN